MLNFVLDRTFYYSVNPQLRQNIRDINKESVELTFVYPTEGCGKTQSEINDTIPHTVVDMGYQGTESAYPHESTRSVSVVPSRPSD